MIQAPSLLNCPVCQGTVASNAPSCPHCGYRPPGSPPAARSVNTSALALGLGALLIGAGSFLPWVTATSIISVSRSGLDGGGDGMVTLGIGIVLVLVAVASLGSGGLGGIPRVLGFLGGAGAIVVAVIDGSDISSRIAGISNSYVTASMGMGLYVVGIGGALALLASLFGARAQPPAPISTPVA